MGIYLDYSAQSLYFYLYLPIFTTYFYLFSCIFLHIFMYISTYFYIFIHISTYLLLFFTCRALHLLLPASGNTCLAPQKCVVLLQIATKVCCFTIECHKSVLHLIQFTDIYHISVVFYYSLTQKCGIYELQNVPQNG